MPSTKFAVLSLEQFYRLAEALGGIPILGTLPGTPAASAGLRYGDILLSIEGQQMASVSDYIETTRSRGKKVLATIFRDGAEQEVTLDFEGRRCKWDPNSALEYLLRSDSGDGGPDGSPVLN